MRTREQNRKLKMYCTGLTLVFVLVGIYFCSYMIKTQRQLANLNAEVKYQKKISDKQGLVNSLNKKIDELTDTHDMLLMSVEIAQNELTKLTTTCDQKQDELNKMINDIDLLSTYNYALYDTAGKRNDISLDILRYGVNMAKERNLNPDLIFGIIMVESEGHANATNPKSGAAGLGQFIPSTGEYISKTYLKAEYDHSVTPYDPVKNIELMVTYLDHLVKKFDGDMMKSIKEYCGGTTDTAQKYYNRVVKAVGHEID